ncbi:unnamed protein product [Gordionus sp. m RMFG-2023]|uniref:phenylalanine--tRNA ligase beta subunit-like isoform X2 n=1 Tax=Gordionus sp. m RMFG-2023 TaxID=3053472 RepID=UPI0030E0F01C
MPVISVNRSKLFELMGRNYTDKEFSELLFDYGLELDEITSDIEIQLKEKGVLTDNMTIKKDDVLYKIETPANRYDLLCLEGLVYSLLVYIQKISIPRIFARDPGINKEERIYITKNTKLIRPYIVCAILRNFQFTNRECYLSFIDYQDRLHQTIARKRTLVSIGTHDYDMVKGPFTYDAKSPEKIEFVPLNQTKSYKASELMELYNKESHLRPYLNIIKDSPLYPVVLDYNGVVLSLPPIINSDHSKITLDTKNIFIECTATDLHKAKIVVESLSGIFSKYCAKPYEVEIVQVIDSDSNSRFKFPEFVYRKETLSVKETNKIIGINCDAPAVNQYLTKMGYFVSPSESGNDSVHLEVSPLRSDVLHVRDIMEDVGVAYGFNNIPHRYPQTCTIANQLPINKLTEILRDEIVAMGYTEVLTFSLCSKDDVYRKMRKCESLSDACVISNPKTIDFEVVRTSLIPGILKVISSSKNIPLPLKLFEISDVVFKDDNFDVGARNQRNACIVRYSKTGGAGFEVVHGIVDRILQIVGCHHVLDETSCEINGDKKTENSASHVCEKDENHGEEKIRAYFIREGTNPTYFDGRCASVYLYNYSNPESHFFLGNFGIIHPEVVKNFDLTLPCSALEINIDLLISYCYE